MSKKRKVFIVLVFLLFTGFNIFYKLDGPTVRMWDESRSGINAMEMMETGDLLVTRFEGQPDLWYTKPPLVVGMQAGLMALFGRNELSLRLPSAMAALLTCLLLFWFGAQIIANWRIGFLAGLSLVSMKGYIAQHVTRTGDTDGVLTFFVVAYVLFFYIALTSDGKKSVRFLLGAALCLGLATLTKSSAGMLMLPGLFVWTAFQQHKSLKTRACMLTILTSGAGLLAVFYFFREMAASGLLQTVWETEWAGRYVGEFPALSQPWNFFWEDVIKTGLNPFIYWIPLCLRLSLSNRYGDMRKPVFFAFLISVTYLVIISIPSAKMEWYDAQIYPFMALIIAFGMVAISEAIQLQFQDKRLNQLVLPILTVALIGPSYYQMYRINNSCADPKFPENERAGYAIEQMNAELPTIHFFSVLSPDLNQSAMFYAKSYSIEKGKTIAIVNAKYKDANQKNPVLVCHDALNDSLDLTGRALLWKTDYGCMLYGPSTKQ